MDFDQEESTMRDRAIALLDAIEQRRPQTRLGIIGVTLACLATAFAARLALEPLLGPDRFVFGSFYLAMIAVLLLCGARAALAATLASCAIIYVGFASPVWTLAFKSGALLMIWAFAVSAVINIGFFSALQARLGVHAEEREAAEAAAEGHAEMFRTFNERTTNHLQLIASLLNARADDGGVTAQEAFEHASRQTMVISRRTAP